MNHETYMVVRITDDGEVSACDGMEPNKFFGETRSKWQLDDLALHSWLFKAVLQSGSAEVSPILLFYHTPEAETLDHIMQLMADEWRKAHPQEAR